MPAHFDMTESDARKIVSWIRSLTGNAETATSLPQAGRLNPTLDREPMVNGVLVISASYTDEGGENIKPLTGQTSVTLRDNRMSVTGAQNLQGYQAMEFGGNSFLLVPDVPGSFSFNRIDLTGIQAVEITAVSQQPLDVGYTIELRIGGPEGRLIGEGELEAGQGAKSGEGIIQQIVRVPIEPVTGGEFHDLYFVSSPNRPDMSVNPVLSGFEFIGE